MARPEFKPTKAQRRRVELFAGEVGEEDIAADLNISRTTLRKHFAAELALGRVRVLGDNLARLDKAASKGNVTAARALVARKDIAVPSSPKSEKPGKKAAAEAAAPTAAKGTSWADVIH